MAEVEMMLTSAGLDALVDAQNGITAAITIAEVGLSDTPFVMAPTLDAVPNEFKRIDSFSGESSAENVIHMTAVDNGDDVYEMTGFGLYLDDGTLFATYSQAEPVFAKLSIATFLHSIDIYFDQAVVGDIVFGDTTFLYPPATEERKGAARIATQAKVNMGTDDEDFVTPLKLKTLLDAVLGGYATAGQIAALQSMINDVDDALGQLMMRSINGGGLVSGGGDLSQNRTLTVTPATGAEIAAGTANNKAVTPLSLAQVPQDFTGHIIGLGGLIIKHGKTASGSFSTSTYTLPVAFPNAFLRVLVNPDNSTSVNEDDERWWSRVLNQGQFQIGKGGVGASTAWNWIALGY